jgi:hypothetical protein
MVIGGWIVGYLFLVTCPQLRNSPLLPRFPDDSTTAISVKKTHTRNHKRIVSSWYLKNVKS